MNIDFPPALPAVPSGVRLLGLTGAPGVGKSTVAAVLAQAVAGAGPAVVPMDGFHYADVELRRRGLLDRKGAPETFDAEGYAVLLRRVRRREEAVVAPAFDRDPSTGSGHRLEQPLAGAIAVPPSGTVVTEGNYLLVDQPRWRAVREHVDVVWHLHVDDALRRERLLARHVRHGKSPEEARAWVDRVDEPNARLVAEAAGRADLLLDLTGWTPPGSA